MNKAFIIFIFISINSIFGQNSDKEVYYYFEDEKISKSYFETLNKEKIYTKKIENDSIIIQNIYLRKKVKTLDSVKLQQVKMLLTKIIGSDYSPEIKTMIHLYSKNNKKIFEDTKRKHYWRWIKRNSKRYQSFLIATKDFGIITDKKNHIYSDEYNLLENLFFNKSNFKINHLLIKPNGTVYIYFGMNDISSALDWSID
ncbi:hypothetical protein [Algibacter sp. PT7-4]|uniref:hypothetical protein n=1 Tax=Algibacter ulvanivorans TaxID=3400999 RepID=UPI003AABDEC1